jgi:DNA segregation ATPase FtsK/SpoIIIE-like protein
MDRRRELYQEYPGVDSLAAYNSRAPEPLRPVVCLVDEATALLQDASAEAAIRTLVLRARKFGLWCVLGGQSWKASVLDTTIRDQLATRVQFKAMSASQSRVLLEQSGAERLDVPGRALAILPGRDLFEMQAPYISHRAIAGALGDGGPRQELPEVAAQDDGRAAQIRELAGQGLSLNEIQRQVFGYCGGAAFDAVKAVLG